MFPFIRLTTFALITCVCLLSVVNSFALSINNDVGLTPHKGEFILRVQSRYTLKGDDPTDIAVDTRGRIYVVDWANYRVQIYE